MGVVFRDTRAGDSLFLFERRKLTMLKKNIVYTDYNGNERNEPHYFNLSKAELMEMEMGTTGGFAEMLNRIIEAKDGPSIMKVFKDVILKSYGEKSADGKRFIKSEEISIAFSQTEAYSVLFMELVTDADKASEFINGIIPADVASAANTSTPAIAPAK
jgi:hypothetical protein